MPQEFQVLQCYQCSTFQVHQVKKSTKWNCKLCGEKQSIKKVYGRGSGVDCRKHVQKLNSLRADIDNMEASRQQTADCQLEDENYSESCPDRTSPFQSVSNISERWSKFVDKEEGYGEEELDKPLERGDVCFVTDRRQFKEFHKSHNRTRNNKRKKEVLYDDDDGPSPHKYISDFEEYSSPSAVYHSTKGHHQFLEGQGHFKDRHGSVMKTGNSDSEKCISGFSKWGQFTEKENSFSNENDLQPCSTGQGHPKIHRNTRDFSWSRNPCSKISKWGKYADEENDYYNNDDETVNVDEKFSAINYEMKTQIPQSNCHGNIRTDGIKYSKITAANCNDKDKNCHKLRGVASPAKIDITGNKWEEHGNIKDSLNSVQDQVTNSKEKFETAAVGISRDLFDRKLETVPVSISKYSLNRESLCHDQVIDDMNSCKYTGDGFLCVTDNSARQSVDRRAIDKLTTNSGTTHLNNLQHYTDGRMSDVSLADRPLFVIGDITEEDLQL